MLGVDDVLKFGASEGTCWLNGCWLLVVKCWVLMNTILGVVYGSWLLIMC